MGDVVLSQTNDVAQFESGPSALLYMSDAVVRCCFRSARALRALDVAVRNLECEVGGRVPGNAADCRNRSAAYRNRTALRPVRVP